MGGGGLGLLSFKIFTAQRFFIFSRVVWLSVCLSIGCCPAIATNGNCIMRGPVQGTSLSPDQMPNFNRLALISCLPGHAVYRMLAAGFGRC